MKNKLKLLPKGWVETTIEDICTSPQYGYTTKAVEKGDIKLLRTTDITSGKINWETVPYCLKNPENPEKYFLKEGDIVISRAGSVGISYLIIKPEKAVFASYLIRFNPLINKKHFKYFLESPIYWSNISEKKLGIAVQNVNATKLKSIKLPIPSLPEQHCIVAKIEELFSELDNGIENLKKAQEQLKTYRQAVLKYAFEGKLTKEWRTLKRQVGNPPEPAKKLLERIRKEREKHYQQQIVKWKQAVTEWKANGEKGKKPTRISRPKTLSKLTSEETVIYGELPTSWRWATLCNVTYKVGDIDHKMPKDFTGGLPYLSTGNLKKDGTIDFANAKTISKEDFKRLSLKIKPERGDIIFPRYGTIGRNILINFNKEFLVSYSCAIIKNIPSLMDGKFVYYYSLSPVIKKEIEKYTVQTTQANIGIASIENFVFPLCSLPEQQAIVSEIDSRLSVCDKIEQTIEDSLKKAEALRQSILKKAFSGELTRDWREKHPELITGENSAEKLLKKIKAEKALAAGRRKPRSKKTKKK